MYLNNFLPWLHHATIHYITSSYVTMDATAGPWNGRNKDGCGVVCRQCRGLSTTVLLVGTMNSPGMPRVVPDTNSATLHPGLALEWFWCPSRTHQPVGLALRTTFSCGWKRSTNPLAMGWYANGFSWGWAEDENVPLIHWHISGDMPNCFKSEQNPMNAWAQPTD